MNVRTRMAPSPTGEYHVGHIATLLKNYAFARKHAGSFILRIEDTDQKRKVDGAVEKILEVITSFGLDWDEGPVKGGPHAPYFQSERLPIYKQAVQKLINSGLAYYCFATSQQLDEMREKQIAAGQPPRYNGMYRDYPISEALKRIDAGEQYVIRLRVPSNESITFQDMIRGEITFNSNEVDDQVLLKSDGFPTYHLAVVVDDQAMEITHVMRGEEWISSTPKHILLYKAFGWKPPQYAHIPVFLNPDGKGKMSKRKGTVSAQSFLDLGYLPEAMLNFFMILGWAHPEQKEIMDLDEYIQHFDPVNVSPNSVVFDLKKLDWFNGMYLRQLSHNQLKARIAIFIPTEFPAEKVDQVLPLISERLAKLSDFKELTDFFYQTPVIDQALLTKKSTPEAVAEQLKLTVTELKTITDWTTENLEIVIRQLQEKHDWKKNQYFMMLRIATTGKTATPPLFETMTVIGKDEIITRLQNAHSSLAT